MTEKKLNKLMDTIGESTRSAAKELTKSSHQKRNQAIIFIARSLLENMDIILKANSKDIDLAREKQLPDAMIDRLMLNETRIRDMAESQKVITEIQNPINRVTEEWTRPNGMKIQRVTVPLGVIGIIYESRPNVTADAAALCIKSGNAVILRGGSESFESNKAIHYCLQEALRHAELNPDIVQIVPTKDRDAVGYMLSSMRNYLDVIVPRGGKSLVKRVQDEARIPVIGHLEGICHVYIHKSAEIQMAREVVLNAKMRRTGICGAAETVLIHREIAPDIVQILIEDLNKVGCEIRGNNEVQSYSEVVVPSNQDDWSTEYLDAIISFRIVDDTVDAINHIERYGSGHTDSIISEDKGAVDMFIKEVDSAIVMHNTSTQFADGGEFGMGAEIGIATGRIHARGPVGAMQLTSYKYVVRGNGQTRP